MFHLVVGLLPQCVPVEKRATKVFIILAVLETHGNGFTCCTSTLSIATYISTYMLYEYKVEL